MLRNRWTASAGTRGRLAPELLDGITGIRTYWPNHGDNPIGESYNKATKYVVTDLFGPELVTRALDYLFGTHPDHNYSFVSAVGNRSKHVACGNNRADFTFIAGGVVPGLLILKPDFPENMDDCLSSGGKRV